MPNKTTNPTVLTVVEVAKILRIGKISAYQAIERGEVPSIRIGRRILIPRFALEQLLTRPSATKQKADVLR
jgi:excisionase family DNA binding protein